MVIAALFHNTTASAVRAMAAQDAATDSGGGVALNLTYEHVPGATSAQTYAVRVGGDTGATVRLNGTDAARRFGGVSAAV